MKIEHEKMNIEKEKVVLETKVKHIGEQSKTLYMKDTCLTRLVDDSLLGVRCL